MIKTIINILIILFGVFFTIGYIIISNNNVYYGDDLHIIDQINKYGLLNLSLNLFLHFECPLTVPINISILYLSSKIGGIFILNNFILATNIVSFYLFISLITERNINQFYKILFSIFVISTIYSATRAIGGLSAIFWGIGQLAYALPLTYLFLALYFFIRFKKEHKKIFLHILGILCVVLLNTRLNYCIFFITYVLGYYAYSFKYLEFKGSPLDYLIKCFKNKNFKTIFIYSLLGLTFYVVNPGNFERIKFDGQSDISFNLWLYIKGILINQKHFYITNFSNIRFLIVLILLSILIVFNFRTKISILLDFKLLILHFFVFTVSLSLQSVLMMIIFGTPIYQGRIYLLSEFLFLLLYAHFFYVFFMYFLKTINYTSIFPIVLSILIGVLALEVFFITNQIKITSEFKKAHEERIFLINKEKLKGRKNPLYVDELPDSGILGIAEISNKEIMKDDKVYYENKRIENFYNLPFKIYIRSYVKTQF